MKYREIGKARRRAHQRKADGILSNKQIQQLLDLDLKTGHYNNPKTVEVAEK